MAARALSFGISVVNGKRQSDDHDDQNDEFIVAHSITPFEGQSQAPSVSFLPGAMLRHYFNTYILVASTHHPGVDFRLLLCYNDGRKVVGLHGQDARWQVQ